MAGSTLRILHTSDWHLGRTLCGRKRYGEHEAFLTWLVETMAREAVDVLIVAGDVFDNSAPTHRAQELYYRFLCRISETSCRHVVIVAGNHDSPSFLDAPKELLLAMSVRVVGAASASARDDVFVLSDGEGAPELIVCAVPYLRDRDVRESFAHESEEDKSRNLAAGIRARYAAAAEIAEALRAKLGGRVSIVATGHLFAAGGTTVDGDGVRELYVGSLTRVSKEIFPACFDYVALGHLHGPQTVGGLERLRYSGAPLPMGFSDANGTKSVCLISLSDAGAEIGVVEVPTFKRLESVRGDLERIERRIRELESENAEAWLEVIYDGDELVGELRETIGGFLSSGRVEILRVKNARLAARVLEGGRDGESLADLRPEDVFERCLLAHDVAEELRPKLRAAYLETLRYLEQEDARAE